MAGALIKLTKAGIASLIGPGNVGTVERVVVSIGIATAPFEHNDDLVTLPHERSKRITAIAGKNIAPDTIHVTMRDDSTDQYTMYGFGFYLDNGALLGTYSQPTPIVEKSSLSWMVTSADIQFTKIDAALLVFGDATFVNPPATETVLGVVELATQAETDAGTDDSRALTPLKAARRYAALSGAAFGGETSFTTASTDTNAQVLIKGKSGALGREAKLRFFGTFGGATADTGTRFAASIRAGFNGGAWGTEYLDAYVNSAGNDTQSDGAQVRVLRLTKDGAQVTGTTLFGTAAGAGWANADAHAAYFYGPKGVSVGSVGSFLDLIAGNSPRMRILPNGSVLIGTTDHDGQSRLQVVGDAGIEGNLHVKLANGGLELGSTATANTPFVDFHSSGNNNDYDGRIIASGGSPTPGTGVLTHVAQMHQFQVGGVTRFAVNASGRVLINKTDDDGTNALQVNGNARFASGVQSNGWDSGGANYRAAAGTGYGVFLRNDGANVYWLQTAKDDPYGTFNSFRPFSWNLTTGAVAIDGGGAGTNFGGTVSAKSFQTSGAAGTQREIQILTGTSVRWKLFADSTAESGSNYGSDLYIQAFSDNGAYLANPFVIQRRTGRVIMGNGVDIGGNLALNRGGNNEGQILAGGNDGYFFANSGESGWYSQTLGSFRYKFSDRKLYVGDAPVLTTGGGQLTGQLRLVEGSPTLPSLSFENDGAPDTGLFHISDGSFGITCNGGTQVRFTPGLTVFDAAVQAPTPPPGNSSRLLATTEFVQSTISAAMVGLIVIEARANVRAGYVKLNGALLLRADYPALWAYAQASGNIVTEEAWSAGNWGAFSWGTDGTNFRIPDVRGEHPRFWDDGRGVDRDRKIGSYQAPQNLSHDHIASASAVGDHLHGAWTDGQGAHRHQSGIHRNSMVYGGGGPQDDIGENPTDPVYTSTDGHHIHNVGISYAGAHGHDITVYANGGTEVRVRTVALLAMMRAF